MGSIKHAKTSPVPNPLGDTRRVGGGDWNSEHVIDLEVADIEGLEARLIPVEQVEQFRDDALAFRNDAAGSASDAAASAAEAAATVGALAAPGGAELIGTPEGTVQEALDGRVKQNDPDSSDQVLYTPPSGGVRPVRDKLAETISLTDYDEGDGDDAMQARAVAYCKTLPVARLVIPPGDYTATDTWEFDLPNRSSVEFLGKITSSVSGKPAIRIGSSEVNHYGYFVTGVDVARSSFDTSSGSIGIEIANVFSSCIQTRWTQGFTDGILLNGTQSNGGVSYLDLSVGWCYNNKRNLRFTASGVGYCNEINVYGGRFGYSSAYADYTGTVNATIDHFAGNRLNNIRLFGPSFEAVNAATRAAVISGRYCLIVHPRMENSADSTGFAIEFTANSEACNIIGKGFGLNTSNIIDAGTNNSYRTKQTTFVRNEAGVDVPIQVLQSNASNSAYSLLGRLTGGTTGWSIRQSGQAYFAASAYAETGFRWSSSSGTFTDRGIFVGLGSPEGAVSAATGSLYANNAGGASALWSKFSGTGNTTWLPVQLNHGGNTASRPVTPPGNYMYFDTTLGKPIWWKASASVWVDAIGTTV